MARESKASRIARAALVCEKLANAYPESKCALHYETPFQLLVATLCSAQTTDLAVNKATKVLFGKFPDPEAMATAPLEEIEGALRGIGLWRNKSKNIRELAGKILEFGAVPRTVSELVTLPGVGRKTATAVLGQAFGIAAGITVDTHMLRINKLLGFSKETDPTKMALDLENLIPSQEWVSYTHRIIDHGRLVCVANRPRCGVCPLAEACKSAFDSKAGYAIGNDLTVPGSAKGLSYAHQANSIQ